MRTTLPGCHARRRLIAAATTAAAACIIALLVGLQPGSPGPALAAGPQDPASVISGSVRVTNVTYGAFTVSWLSSDAVTGAIRYGATPDAVSTIAGDEVPGPHRVHHALVWPLSENTRYFYDILTGSSVDDNGGVHYLQTTGPTLGLPALDHTICGVVVTATQATTNAVVYATLQDAGSGGTPGQSAPVSMLGDEFCGFNAGTFLAGDLGAYFSYSASVDRLAVGVQGDPQGQATSTFTLSEILYPLSRTVTMTAGILPSPPDPAPLPGGSGPDLVVESLQSTLGWPVPGCSATFSVTVRNTGNVSAAAPFQVALYLDHSRVPYSGERSNTNTYWIVNSDLAPSAAVVLSSLSPFAASGVISRLLTAGDHTVYARADSYSNQVAELNESNNLFGPVTVTGQGDCQKIIYLPLVFRSH